MYTNKNREEICDVQDAIDEIREGIAKDISDDFDRELVISALDSTIERLNIIAISHALVSTMIAEAKESD